MRRPAIKPDNPAVVAPELRLWKRPKADSVVSEHGSDTRSDLRSSLGDAASFSVMVGMGETYLPAFVLALGLGQVASGLITTIPMLAGAVLQLVSPAAVRRLGSHRSWVVACAVCQAACFLPLCAAAWYGSMPLWAVFAVAAVYWGSGLATGPAWNTWVGTIVPTRLRARYFARRTRLSQICVLSGFLIAGVSLQYGASAGHPLTVFGILFCVSALSRFASAGFLLNQSEPVPPGDDHRHVPLAEFVSRIRSSGEGRLIAYLLAVQTAAQIAGPYFTAYMLGPLKLSYGYYVLLIAVSFAAKVIALPAFGAVAHRWGARRLLVLGGIGIVPLSSLWCVSDSLYYLFCVQIVAGTIWAAYELAMFLLFFETMPAEERTSLLTTFNFANSLAIVAGSLIGGAILATWGKGQHVYLTLFALSTAARGLSLIVLARVPRFAVAGESLGLRTLGMRAGSGSLDQPILPSIGVSVGELDDDSHA
jgi:MFS family permease